MLRRLLLDSVGRLETDAKAALTTATQALASQRSARRLKSRGKATAQPPRLRRGMRIAIEGCCHGELDAIYSTLQQLEAQQNKKIDLLICCGDFQAVRNLDDLECLAAPQKYRELRTFYKYYSGETTAPYPTLFIGGNHEASNFLWELYYGGWAAPNIFYLGHAGVINFGGVRIGGLSGTYVPHDYRKGHFEGAPYTPSSMRSAYHLRELEVHRMRRLRQPLDVMLTHDWPDGIAFHGDFRRLFQQKKHLRAEIERRELGSKPGRQLLDELRPRFWFAAHYHVKFPALVRHAPVPVGGAADADRLSEQFTNFLALDKCLPGRKFLQVVDFPDAVGTLEFSYDEEWLSILRETHNLLSLRVQPKPLPGMGAHLEGTSQASRDAVRAALEGRGGAAVPLNFAPTAPPHASGGRRARGSMPQRGLRNPQTEAFLHMLGLTYNLEHGGAGGHSDATGGAAVPNPEEIELDETEELDESALANPEEIDIDVQSEDEPGGEGSTAA